MQNDRPISPIGARPASGSLRGLCAAVSLAGIGAHNAVWRALRWELFMRLERGC